MPWHKPIPLDIVPDADPEGFRSHPEGVTGLPVGDAHPGAFGFVRANHIHEGVDLYAPEGTPVMAVEDGIVVAVIPFTGPSAVPPSPWWRETQAILVEGETGVVVYGEVGVGTGIREGVRVGAGETIGHVTQVLTKDKGRPMTMLHLELHRHGTRDAYEWTKEGGVPMSLRNPTPHLLAAIEGPGPATGTPTRAVRYDRDAYRIQRGDDIVAMALRLSNDRWGLYDRQEQPLTRRTWVDPRDVARAFDEMQAQG